MNYASITICAILAIALLSVLLLHLRRKRIEECIFSNAIPGAFMRHEGNLVRTLDAAVSTRWLVAKEGSACGYVAVCGATDRPIGIMEDVGDAGESVPVTLLGIARTTLPGVAAVAIAIGDKLYTAANGKVTNVSATGAYALGYALTATDADGIVEIDPRPPFAAVS